MTSEMPKQLTTNNQPTRTAILDLGTNTFHLLIADIEKQHPFIVYQDTIDVKLGEGGISRGIISSQAFERGINAIKEFKDRIVHYDVSKVKSAATSAVRTASNGPEFITAIKNQTGLNLEIIDGEREAELIYFGVRAAVNLTSKALIVDIGGGSVEFIICDNSTIFWKHSYPIGAARMMEKFHQNDPITKHERDQLKQFLDETLSGLQDQLYLHAPDVLVGSAGSFETFAALQDPEFKPAFSRPEFNLDLNRFRKISEWIEESTHHERSQMHAIPTVRVDMIVVATMLTKYILTMREFKSFKLSTYSLKEGVLFEMLM
ncbi:Ppx/GppA phosphatase family protein [Daejeonella lutea]|uniref:Exopolyphosphatase / guanosine-5'-triphosphate,3'-diphosphate pyrophosphatase n=1 Tax=Daejeonella lutea TaxID=572036 RepID=A0A1T5EY86_9SPHI|nr:hypothetical protein [Daejeonella lutea]SKB88828.1 exopolyphosphatase / guanosine-5'-triphosphate,3'-diphosphate pyrophosphatase [Daejeonella lutea]